MVIITGEGGEGYNGVAVSTGSTVPRVTNSNTFFG